MGELVMPPVPFGSGLAVGRAARTFLRAALHTRAWWTLVAVDQVGLGLVGRIEALAYDLPTGFADPAVFRLFRPPTAGVMIAAAHKARLSPPALAAFFVQSGREDVSGALARGVDILFLSRVGRKARVRCASVAAQMKAWLYGIGGNGEVG